MVILNDYSLGALQALSWAKQTLKKHGYKQGLTMIEETIQKIVSGVAVDFSKKIEKIETF